MSTLAPTISRTTPGIHRRKPSQSDAMEKLQNEIRDEVSLSRGPDEKGISLRANAESYLLAAEGGEAKGTCVLYHGFTAGPWQYREMARDLQDAGYNVYVPRMPGHGLAGKDGKPSHARMPKAGEQDVWSQFVDKTVDRAAQLGAPVHTVGLSGGGNVALEAGSKNPKVESVTAIAPFLGGNGVTGVLFPVLNVVDMVTFGLFGKLLDRIPRKDKEHSEETPKTEGSWGNALAMYRVGAQVDKVDARLQLITTAQDPLSGTRKVKRLVKKSKPPKVGWYHFPKQEKVKHAMVSPVENPNTESVLKIREIIRDFAEGKASVNR